MPRLYAFRRTRQGDRRRARSRGGPEGERPRGHGQQTPARMNARLLACAAAFAAGCGTSNPGADVAAPDARGDGAPPADGALPADAAPPADASPPADVPGMGDGGTCAVSDAGALQPNYFCDLGSIHVLQRDGAAA